MNYGKKFIFGFWLFFVFWTFADHTGTAQTTFKLTGIVCDSTTRLPLEMVAVVMPEINRWCLTDNNGSFEINSLFPGEYELNFQLLGFRQQRMVVQISGNVSVSVFMSANTLRLSEVKVTASENKTGATASIIDASAMTHLQPSSFNDLLELLPGHSAQKSDMASVSSITLRQAGSARDELQLRLPVSGRRPAPASPLIAVIEALRFALVSCLAQNSFRERQLPNGCRRSTR